MKRSLVPWLALLVLAVRGAAPLPARAQTPAQAATAEGVAGEVPPDPAGELHPDAAGELHQELVPRYRAAEIVERLKNGGHVLLLRHMETERSPDSGAGVDYADCSTQRELSERGRQQARTLGEAFRQLGIPVGEILVSPYCRCRETAALAFGREATTSELLSTWDTLSVEEKTERGARIRGLLDTPPAPGTNTVLVTHTGNLMWSLGLDSRPEGLVHVFRPTGLEIARPDYLGRVDPDAWRALAGLPEPHATDAGASSEASDPPQP